MLWYEMHGRWHKNTFYTQNMPLFGKYCVAKNVSNMSFSSVCKNAVPQYSLFCTKFVIRIRLMNMLMIQGFSHIYLNGKKRIPWHNSEVQYFIQDIKQHKLIKVLCWEVSNTTRYFKWKKSDIMTFVNYGSDGGCHMWLTSQHQDWTFMLKFLAFIKLKPKLQLCPQVVPGFTGVPSSTQHHADSET